MITVTRTFTDGRQLEVHTYPELSGKGMATFTAITSMVQMDKDPDKMSCGHVDSWVMSFVTFKNSSLEIEAS